MDKNIQHQVNFNWEEQVWKRFADSPTEGMDLQDIVLHYLATVAHTLEHYQGYVKFTTDQGIEYLETSMDDEDNIDPENIVFIPMSAFAKWDINKEDGQSAKDFLDEHFNVY